MRGCPCTDSFLPPALVPPVSYLHHPYTASCPLSLRSVVMKMREALNETMSERLADRERQEAGALAAAIIGSTVLAIAVGAACFVAVAKWTGNADD